MIIQDKRSNHPNLIENVLSSWVNLTELKTAKWSEHSKASSVQWAYTKINTTTNNTKIKYVFLRVRKSIQCQFAFSMSFTVPLSGTKSQWCQWWSHCFSFFFSEQLPTYFCPFSSQEFSALRKSQVNMWCKQSVQDSEITFCLHVIGTEWGVGMCVKTDLL